MALFIVGAGGVGREAHDIAIACGIEVDGFVADELAGPVRALAVRPPEQAPPGALFVVAIGDPSARRRLAAVLGDHGLRPTSLVHPRAAVASDAIVGDGCLVMAGAYVSSTVVLHEHVQVHANATVGHDAQLGAHSTVLPGANVGGAVRLGAGATIGSGAVVLPGTCIGEAAVVGAGAVVTHDVAPSTTVAGVPARPR